MRLTTAYKIPRRSPIAFARAPSALTLRVAGWLLGALALLLPAAAPAGEPPAGESGGTPRWRSMLVPETHLSPLYIADPHRATNALQVVHFSRSEIPDSGSLRFGLKLGGRFGLVRFHPEDDPERGVQISLDVGFHGVFDQDHALDNVGWDGIYALIVAWQPRGPVAYKFGSHHTSSHVGDEFAERTGRERIEYTRQEFFAGASAPFGDGWQAYGELGYAYDLRNAELMDEGRVQAGVQFESKPTMWRGRVGWYAALDTSAYQEDGWRVNIALQSGFALPTGARVWRLGGELYDGRSVIGEFFFRRERSFLLGLWIDL